MDENCEWHEEMAADAEITLAELRSYFKPELWVKFLSLLREGHKNGFLVIKLIFGVNRVVAFRKEEIIK